MKKDSGRYTDASLVPENIDCVITIGGDGTLIQAARDLAGRDIPLIGINQGHLGYLTQVRSKEDIPSMADALLSERYQIENRMMLDGKILRQGKKIASDIALNEIVLTHRNTIQILRLWSLCKRRIFKPVYSRRPDCGHPYRIPRLITCQQGGRL